MTSHHSGPSAAEEIYRILPVFVGLPTDEVTAEQDHTQILAGQKADTAELDLAYRNISARPLKRGFGLVDNVEIERTVANLMPRTVPTVAAERAAVRPATVLLRRLEKWRVPSRVISAADPA